MEWIVMECVETADCELEVSAAFVGEDVLICLKGGERPHLGCVVQTEPRVSLTGDGSVSATSSVLNFPGHKDEVICRWMAEKVSKELGKRVFYPQLGVKLCSMAGGGVQKSICCF